MVGDKTVGSRVFTASNTIIMLILMIVTLYPFWYAIVGSLDSGQDLATGTVYWWPRVFTFASYREVLADPGLLHTLWITASRTAIVTAVSILYTAMFAYAFSRPYLRGKRWYTLIGLASMYVSAGLVPQFLLFDWLGMYNNYIVYILPSLFMFWNVIIFNSNFKGIPESLIESAKLDGASEFKIFFRIILPISKPVLAALSVFTAVQIWNDYQTTLYFTQSSGLQTLQYFILQLIQTTSAAQNLASNVNPAVSQLLSKAQGQGLVTAQTVELAAMVVASIPMIIIYPFAQRFFIKGILLGSVKE